MSFCTNCGKPSDAEAKFCGHCGKSLIAPKSSEDTAQEFSKDDTLSEKKEHTPLTRFVGIFILLIFFGCFALAIKGFIDEQDRKNHPPAPILDEAEIRKKSAENTVLSQLKDPNSAIFSDEQYQKYSGCVTGSVNSKNGFGGYVGSQSFVVDSSSHVKFGRGDIISNIEIQHDCDMLDAQNQLKVEKDPETRERLKKFIDDVKKINSRRQ